LATESAENAEGFLVTNPLDSFDSLDYARDRYAQDRSAQDKFTRIGTKFLDRITGFFASHEAESLATDEHG
jgi:hypothetical protein